MGELNPFNYACGGKEWRAWDKGHAVGKVEGWNEAIEAVLKLNFNALLAIEEIQALRKEGGG